MKTVSLITVHRTLNYGTILQTYACKIFFKQFGYSITLIDYYRKNDFRESDFCSIWCYIKARKERLQEKGISKQILCTLKAIVSYSDTKKFYTICNYFLEKHIPQTQQYFSYQELEKNPPNADVFCSGSDQIWNSDYNEGFDFAYFLAFVAENNKKISFASSIGKGELSEQEKDEFGKMLRDFSAVSVREKSSLILLNQIGINAEAILDPTLLLEAKAWEQLRTASVIKKPYLLLYKLKGNSEIDKIAQAIAKEKKLQVVQICFSKAAIKSGIKSIVLPKIGEFLSLFYYADFVVTNSFHGTCFSITFEKQFLCVAREKYNIRIRNILDLMGIKRHIFCSLDEFLHIGFEKVDFDEVNKTLQKQRHVAMEWLRNALVS